MECKTHSAEPSRVRPILSTSSSNSSLSAFQTEGARSCGRSAGTLASVRASSCSSDVARQFPPPHHSVINSASARPSAAVIDERTFSSPSSLFALACPVKWCVSASQSPFIPVYGVEPLPVSPISTLWLRVPEGQREDFVAKRVACIAGVSNRNANSFPGVSGPTGER